MALSAAAVAPGCAQSRAYEAGRDAGIYWFRLGRTTLDATLAECSAVGGWDGEERAEYMRGCEDGWEKAAKGTSWNW